jgi:putative phage-type endonuclease
VNDAEKSAFLSDRCGKLTASRMHQALDMTAKGAEGAKRRALKYEILAERITGDAVPHHVNAFMQWGLDQEPAAKAAFELATGRLITPCRTIDHPEIDFFAATPDGLLPGGVIEFKCPQTTTHVSWLLAGGVPDQHKPQILAQLACTGREHAVFVSFDPRVRDPRKQLHIVEWTPKREEVEEIEEHARKFLAEVEAMFEQLTEKA